MPWVKGLKQPNVWWTLPAPLLVAVRVAALMWHCLWANLLCFQENLLVFVEHCMNMVMLLLALKVTYHYHLKQKYCSYIHIAPDSVMLCPLRKQSRTQTHHKQDTDSSIPGVALTQLTAECIQFWDKNPISGISGHNLDIWNGLKNLGELVTFTRDHMKIFCLIRNHHRIIKYIRFRIQGDATGSSFEAKVLNFRKEKYARKGIYLSKC